MNLADAQKAGVQAFSDGRGRAPALNGQFVTSACLSKTSTTDLLDAYIHGWTIAMLADDAPATMPSVAELTRIKGNSADSMTLPGAKEPTGRKRDNTRMRNEMGKLTTEQRADIRDLMNGAANHGDREQIAICEKALDGDEEAIAECLRIIADDDQGDRAE